MAQLRERAEEKGLAPNEVPVLREPEGSVPDAPALFAIPESKEHQVAEKGAKHPRVAQLPLPIDFEPEKNRPPAKRKQRKGTGGFVPVTRDPDVAQSYSDNVALDYAVARGLAQALQSLPPEELAALRAKVAKAAQHNPKAPPARSSG